MNSRADYVHPSRPDRALAQPVFISLQEYPGRQGHRKPPIYHRVEVRLICLEDTMKSRNIRGDDACAEYRPILFRPPALFQEFPNGLFCALSPPETSDRPPPAPIRLLCDIGQT
jgi:hypothetical protein